ncbi:hypothetical protein [Neolewinella sp.]|uniref:hypothetical protein n=1 Tax=Neolewinella sp. TaxID=2993543 RepID=UPI003B52F2C2
MRNLLILTVLILGCRQAPPAIEDDLGYQNIVDIVRTNYDRIITQNSVVPYKAYPNQISKIISDDDLPVTQGSSSSFASLCEGNGVKLIYICTKEEIWLETNQNDNLINAKRTLIGSVLTSNTEKFKINYYDETRITHLADNWYEAVITFSLVN